MAANGSDVIVLDHDFGVGEDRAAFGKTGELEDGGEDKSNNSELQLGG